MIAANIFLLCEASILFFFIVGRVFEKVFLKKNELSYYNRIVLNIVTGLIFIWLFLIILSIAYYSPRVLLSLLIVFTSYYTFDILIKDFKVEISKVLIVLILFNLFIFISYYWGLMLIYPESGWDGLTAHIPVVKYLIEHHYASIDWNLRNPIFPINAEILMGMNGFFGVQYIKCTSYVATFIICLLASFEINTYKIKWFNKIGLSLLFANMLLGIPVVANFGIKSYIDVTLSMVCFIAIIFSKDYLQSSKKISLLIALISFSIAFGVKYSALMFIPAVMVLVIVAAYRREKHLVLFLLVSILIASIWYIRNFYYTGNPVWPFASNVFGITHDRIWNQADYVGQFADLKRYSVKISSVKDILFSISVNHISEGNGFPVWMWIFFILPILLLLFGYIKRDKKLLEKKYILFYYISFLIFFTCWLKSVPNIRYFMPGIPIFLLISILSMIFLVEFTRDNKILAFIFLSLSTVVGVSNARANKNIFDYTASHGLYEAIPYLQLSNELRPSTNYYGFFSGAQLLNTYSDSIIYGDWFGKYRFSDFNKSCANFNDKTLQELNQDGLIVQKGFMDNLCYNWCIKSFGKIYQYNNESYCIYLIKT